MIGLSSGINTKASTLGMGNQIYPGPCDARAFS